MASRFIRFIAFVLDSVIALAVGLVVFGTLSLSVIIIFKLTDSVNLTENKLIIGSASYIVGYITVNTYFLRKTSQSLGKKICGIAITGNNNTIALLARTIIPMTLPDIYPLLAYLLLLDWMLIFTPKKRCLHDIIFGTDVIKVKPSLSNSN